MASAQQLLVLEAVVQLDHVLMRIMGHMDLLLRVSPEIEAQEGVTALGPAVIAAMREVRARVLANTDEVALDGVERVLCARSAIVRLQLDELFAAESEIDPMSLANAGRLRTVRDFARCLDERLERVNANLLREARELESRAAAPSLHDALFHVAIDNAEFGYRALGRDRDVERFLRAGLGSASKRFRIACETLAVALDLAFISERKEFSAARPKSRQPRPDVADRFRDGHHV